MLRLTEIKDSTTLTSRQIAGHFSGLSRRHKERFYIAFNRKNTKPIKLPSGLERWPRFVWPILFKTREDAETAMITLPIFLNAGKKGRDANRICSASIEKVILKRRGKNVKKLDNNSH